MARAGDELVSVDAIAVLGLSIAQVEALLLGPEGSQVLTHVKYRYLYMYTLYISVIPAYIMYICSHIHTQMYDLYISQHDQAT